MSNPVKNAVDLIRRQDEIIKSQKNTLIRIPALHPDSKIIVIQTYTDRLSGMIDMDSHDYGFRYSQPTKLYHGFQSNIENESDFNRVKELCEMITNAVREIDSIIKV